MGGLGGRDGGGGGKDFVVWYRLEKNIELVTQNKIKYHLIFLSNGRCQTPFQYHCRSVASLWPHSKSLHVTRLIQKFSSLFTFLLTVLDVKEYDILVVMRCSLDLSYIPRAVICQEFKLTIRTICFRVCQSVAVALCTELRKCVLHSLFTLISAELK